MIFDVILIFHQECRKNETVLKTERDQWKEQYHAVNDEVQKLRGIVGVYLMKNQNKYH